MAIELSATAMMYLIMTVNNAIRLALAKIGDMTEDELKEAIAEEEARSDELRARYEALKGG